MSYPSSLSDYWHSLQWSSLTSSIPTDPRACLSSMTSSTFCCLPYLPFWPFSRLADYSDDFDVDDNVTTSSSSWQPPPSALSSFSSSSSQSSRTSHPTALLTAASSSSSSQSFPSSLHASSSLYSVSQPVAQPVFSSHLASATFSSPDQLASVLARQRDDSDDSDARPSRGKSSSKRRTEEDRAAGALSSDMRASRSKSHKSSKRAHRDGGRDKGQPRRESRDKQRPSHQPLNVPRSALSSSPPSIHQDEDLSDSELSTDDEELSATSDRHERALAGIGSKPAAIY